MISGPSAQGKNCRLTASRAGIESLIHQGCPLLLGNGQPFAHGLFISVLAFARAGDVLRLGMERLGAVDFGVRHRFPC